MLKGMIERGWGMVKGGVGGADACPVEQHEAGLGLGLGAKPKPATV